MCEGHCSLKSSDGTATCGKCKKNSPPPDTAEVLAPRVGKPAAYAMVRSAARTLETRETVGLEEARAVARAVAAIDYLADTMQRDAIREREKKRRQRKQQALPGVDLGRDRGIGEFVGLSKTIDGQYQAVRRGADNSVTLRRRKAGGDQTMNTDCACGRAYCEFNVGTCPREPAGPLKRHKDSGGPRDFLAGQPVTCGQPLERLVGNVEDGRGRWVPVRYEAALFRDGAALYIDNTGEHEATTRDRFRWPQPGTTAGDIT
jgi:hypothetical protein